MKVEDLFSGMVARIKMAVAKTETGSEICVYFEGRVKGFPDRVVVEMRERKILKMFLAWATGNWSLHQLRQERWSGSRFVTRDREVGWCYKRKFSLGHVWDVHPTSKWRCEVSSWIDASVLSWINSSSSWVTWRNNGYQQLPTDSAHFKSRVIPVFLVFSLFISL